MERHDVQNGIIRAWRTIEALELGETISTPVPLQVNEEFRNIVLDGSRGYLEIFMAGLKLSHYNFLLVDYSFFQFSWSSPNHVRYAYYPNPFASSDVDNGAAQIKRWQELVSAGLITHEEYLSILRDAKADFRIPLFRYENAPDQHRGLMHPCSHFHIGLHSENRWPLNRVLTPPANHAKKKLLVSSGKK